MLIHREWAFSKPREWLGSEQLYPIEKFMRFESLLENFIKKKYV
jgi:hypothetical protein